MKRIIVLVGLLVWSGYANSQQTLTLEECRNLAIQNNKELQMSGEKVKAANEEKKAAVQIDTTQFKHLDEEM